MVNTSPACSCWFWSLSVQKLVEVWLEWVLLDDKPVWRDGFISVHVPWAERPFALSSPGYFHLSAQLHLCLLQMKLALQHPSLISMSLSQWRRPCKLCCFALFPTLCTDQEGNQPCYHQEREPASLFNVLSPLWGKRRGLLKGSAIHSCHVSSTS